MAAPTKCLDVWIESGVCIRVPVDADEETITELAKRKFIKMLTDGSLFDISYEDTPPDCKPSEEYEEEVRRN